MSARPGGNLAADMVRTAGKAGEAKQTSQWTASVTFCRGCRYAGYLSGMLYCDYADITGKPRTVRNGKKVDMCPRKRQSQRPTWDR